MSEYYIFIYCTRQVKNENSRTIKVQYEEYLNPSTKPLFCFHILAYLNDEYSTCYFTQVKK